MELEKLGKSPVSDSNPAGEDVRFEPEFEQLENELGKLNNPAANNTVDWQKVVDVSALILSGKSKNLLVACYFCAGSMNIRGLSGIADGAQVIRDLLDTFWDSMYPPVKRMRARSNAIEWLSEKIEAGLPDMKKEAWPKEKRDAFLGNLNAIDSFVAEKIENGPLLTTLNANLAALIDEEAVPEPVSGTAESEPEEKASEGAAEKTPEPAQKPPSEAPPPKPAQPAPPPESASAADADGDANGLLKDGLKLLGQAATLYIKQETLTATPFRLNRIVAWMPVQTLPPATDGKTLIPPPDEQIRSSLSSLSQSNNWRDLLMNAESRVRQYLFWLDLHRYTAEALDRLRYPEIGETVLAETAALVRRLPGVEKLAFSDGTPFADMETRDWLKSAAGTGSAADMGGTLSGDATVQHITEAMEEAKKLMKENKTGQALNRFRYKLDMASSLRQRFLWEIALCKLLLSAKQPRLCAPYFKDILGSLDTFKTEQWDPDLALEGLSVVLSGLKLQDEALRDDELMETVLNRISALDPSRALEFL